MLKWRLFRGEGVAGQEERALDPRPRRAAPRGDRVGGEETRGAAAPLARSVLPTPTGLVTAIAGLHLPVAVETGGTVTLPQGARFAPRCSSPPTCLRVAPVRRGDEPSEGREPAWRRPACGELVGTELPSAPLPRGGGGEGC